MKITVFLGGTSAERDVSLASGTRVVAALRAAGHQVTAVDPATGVLSEADEAALRARGVQTAPPSLESLRKVAGATSSRRGRGLAGVMDLPAVQEADVVFLALHGGEGEDGTIQALLDAAGVRYTGSGHLASALAMDKDLSKLLFRAAGVGTADWLMSTAQYPLANPVEAVEGTLGLPVIVKPSKQGSTVGLSVVKTRDALVPAIAEALLYDDEVMIERFIAGREFTVGILGDEALPVGEIIPQHEIYDYECKYTAGMAREVFPADLTAAQTAEMQQQARLAFRALKLGGYARIDFRMSADGGMYCLEANTLPGMTELSLIPQAAAAHGMHFGALCERIVALAVAAGDDGGGAGAAGR